VNVRQDTARSTRVEKKPQNLTEKSAFTYEEKSS